ncbi:hypothetical protein ALC57_13195 [Trachymyrmex cornetzi]|uniref:DNA-directed DNA polymerase n=1 Tax=Trachymyrmex cornetzi TaxID=471704 RepID=A0A151IZQ8_9HYME|nr:hypothetical protein ALC57_13195 [Trachymyrmex cornetzi]
MFPWQILRATTGKNLTALRIVTCARNRSRKTIRRYAITVGRTEAPHSNCNLNYNDSNGIPVVFHNLSVDCGSYDAHFIIKEIAIMNTCYKYTRLFGKPIYVGMCIFDMSKMCLYEFHHEYMASVFREKCKIMYTDTDSLIYHVECGDVYDIMKRDINRFNTSDYTTDNAYSIPLANKKVPGLMKNENNDAIMTKFIELRAKMYALRVEGKKDTKKAKVVKNNVLAISITFEDYKQCLNDAVEMMRKQSRIRSKLHELYTIMGTKIALSPHDDKRYIVSSSRDTLPWGHYRCK